MTTQERCIVRTLLCAAGFVRYSRDKKCEYDRRGKDGRFVGDYTEYWKSNDGLTKIILKWAPKTRQEKEGPPNMREVSSSVKTLVDHQIDKIAEEYRLN